MRSGVAGGEAAIARMGYCLSCEQFGPKELVDQANHGQKSGTGFYEHS